MNRGVLYALGAYLMWGAFPIYFKAVQQVPALEVLAHRMLWSLLFVAALLALLGRWQWLRPLAREPRRLAAFAVSALLVSINWLIYIWAVNAGHIVDASLGYFINPLVNVLIGALFLHERLRPPQWAAVMLAALGVAWLTWQAGQPPWIGLALALTFATYGLMRKRATLGAIEGLAVETALMAPVALLYLAWLGAQGTSAFVPAVRGGDLLLAALLLLAGPVTAVPLLLFAAGARRIPFATLGLLQYVGPTLQLMIGVLLYREPFEPAKAAGYALIWLALALYTLESVWRTWRTRASGDASASPP
ncbi:MAG: EamA family transporter RarD [Burkholderiaceae bacterium]|jgi:chloramphenicol-sensitive protein RarD|nr:EamA family transporter RarD [Burkholderiaceae bacterium]